MMHKCIYPTCVYEQHIKVIIGWHMADMCVHYIFTQMTRIKALQDSSLWCVMWKLVLGLLYSFPSRRDLLKSVSFFALAPKNQYEAVSDIGMNYWVFSSG